MDLNKLYYFYVVAKHQHVTRAAEELQIAQPALSRAVKLLEKDLGVSLFYKYKRNIHLTDSGQHLKKRLDGVFSTLELLPGELQNLDTQFKNTVRLNVLAASLIVTTAIAQYKATHTDVIFQVIQNHEATDCDVSIIQKFGAHTKLPDYLSKTAIDEDIYLAVPKDSPLAGAETIDLRDAKDAPFVSVSYARQMRYLCDRFCAEAGFKPNIVFESDSTFAARNLISAGAGVGFWPAFTFGEVSADMTPLRIREPRCQRTLILGLHDRGYVSDTAKDFYEYLVEFFEKLQSTPK